MLFDLQGKRRRVVQATYLTLAILMGGGLVFFGIGGDVSGGLFDAFSERGGATGNGNSAIEDRIERAEKRLVANPRDEAALKEVIRGYYQLALDDADPNTGAVSPQGRRQLAEAASAWESYLRLKPPKPEPSLAQLMTEVYSPRGLNRPARAVEAAEILVEARPTPQAYVLLTTYATLAGQTRKAELAGRKAIEVAPPGQRDVVKQAVEQAKQATPEQLGGVSPQPGGAAPSPAPGGPSPVPGGPAPVPGGPSPVPGGGAAPPGAPQP